MSYKIERIEFRGAYIYPEITEEADTIKIKLSPGDLDYILGATPFYAAYLTHRKGEQMALFFLFYLDPNDGSEQYEEHSCGMLGMDGKDLAEIACECALHFGRDGRDPADPPPTNIAMGIRW